MKKIFVFGLGSFVLFTACKKAFEQPESYSSFAVIHASPVSSTSPTDTLNVFVDTAKYTAAGVTYLSNSGYLPVLSGDRTINVRRQPLVSSPLYVSSFTKSFERSKIYSFFVYDTTTTATGTARVLRLTDDLTLPAANMAHVRVLHLAPNGPAVDITLLRTSVTPNDSVTIANKSYIGASPNEAALSPFMPVPKGTYTVKVKLAGTQTVATSGTLVLTPGLDVNVGRIVTVFVTGTAKGRPLTIGSFRHY
jgi:hypothetical protein